MNKSHISGVITTKAKLIIKKDSKSGKKFVKAIIHEPLEEF